MQCPRCNALLDDAATQCLHCHTDLAAHKEVAATTIAVDPTSVGSTVSGRPFGNIVGNTSTRRTGSDARSWKIAAIIAGAIAVAAVAAAVVGFMQAGSWRSTADDHGARADAAETRLDASETDVARLEQRQRELSAEKAAVEDEKAVVEQAASDMWLIADTYRLCTENLTSLASFALDLGANPLAYSTYEVTTYIDSAFAPCEDADAMLAGWDAAYG